MSTQEIEHFYPKTKQHWRKWLEKNHLRKDAVWLIHYKQNAGKLTIAWSDAVDEALCFGWIDSKAVTIDETSFKQYYSKRKPKSTWSKVNKEKIKQYKQLNKEKIKETAKEYYELNKEKKLELQKKWREKNKEKIKEKYECECGGKYTHVHKAQHLKTKKHKTFISAKVTCD